MFMNDAGLSSSVDSDQMLNILEQLGVSLRFIARDDISFEREEVRLLILNINIHERFDARSYVCISVCQKAD